jgi:hypothetical protein
LRRSTAHIPGSMQMQLPKSQNSDTLEMLSLKKIQRSVLRSKLETPTPSKFVMKCYEHSAVLTCEKLWDF